MKRQIAFPLVLSITILLLLGGMLYAILAAPTQSSKKLAMTSKHQPTPKITATAANKASAEPTMPNDTSAPQTKITKKYIRIQATDSSLWKYNRKTHSLIITGNGGTNSENAAIIDADSQMDMDDGQRYNIGSFSLDSTAKGRHAANELITKTEKIIIKDGITTINSAAFASFQSLTKITIPNSVKKIGDFALKDCKRLQQITIPASVVKIGGGAFENCTNLYDIKFESGSNCNSMENYPNNPGSSPIQNCKNLRTFQMH